MTEWWTYRLSDLLLFSPQTYYRLFELYNHDIWPLQILSPLLGAAILVLVVSNPPWQGRAISAILALGWLWVAWAYHLQRYATINWVATYFAMGFALEALLLIWTGVIRGRLVFVFTTPLINRAGLGVFLFALIVQPCIGIILGRKWVQMEIVGIAPDPTALATMGILLLTVNRINWMIFIIPLFWSLINGITLWTMHSPQAFVTPLAAALVFLIVLYGKYRAKYQ